MPNSSAINDSLSNATTRTPKIVAGPSQLDLRINGETQVTHTPNHAPIGQEVARKVMELQGIQIAPEKFVGGRIDIHVNPMVLLEALRNADRVEELIDINGEQIDEIEYLKRKLEEVKSLIPAEPKEDEIFYRDNEQGSISYNDLWNRVGNETGVQSFMKQIFLKDTNEQSELIKHIHRSKINSSHVSIQSNYSFSWNVSRGKGSEKSTILAERLNGPLSKNKGDYPTISWLFEHIVSPHARKRVLLYCLYCYSAGIQLKP